MMSSCEILEDLDSGTIYGTWKCTEYSTGLAPVTYQVDINEDAFAMNGVIISNFGQLGFLFEVEATVTGSSIIIPQQQVPDQFGATFSISGSGSTPDNFKTMEWSYEIDGDPLTADLSKI
jgi:hypothetical protein